MNKKLIKLVQWLQLAMLITAGVAVSAVQAQVPMYEGADRTQRLLDGARQEGVLNLYSSMAEKDTSRVAKLFEEKYGIKVNVWRSGKDKVLQRAVAEGAAGRDAADFVWNVAPEMEALHREKLLQPVRSPLQKGLIPEALPKHGEWTGSMVYVFVQAYNSKRVSKEELPRTFQDLLDPRWKGRLGIEYKQQEWFYKLMSIVGEEKGLNQFRTMVANNGLSVRVGSSLLANMVLSGEVDFAVTMYSFIVDQMKANGGNIDYVNLAPVIALTDGIGILKRAKHPYAATLFYDFMLSDGQKMIAENYVPTTQTGDKNMARFAAAQFIDPALILDSYEKWLKLYEETINNRGKGEIKK